METYFVRSHGMDIPINVHLCSGHAKATIVYYHGGGLMYGSGEDLPLEYVETICNAGYHLVCMNYLLAPESPLSHIIDSAYDGLNWLLQHKTHVLSREDCPYVLFGRSSGAFLALILANRLREEGKALPSALWLFYGYYNLRHSEFSGPSKYYQSLPHIPSELVPSFHQAQPRTQARVEERYFLYVYARQQGMWPKMLGATSGEEVPRSQLALLPPAFLTASTGDRDVPFTFSQTMHVSMPNSFFLPVYGLEHDYDRDPQRPESQALYQQAIQWLDGILFSP